ncbi:NDP-hexose 2,3-dehydratase family protein [Pedobacter sp. ISL-64]|uniref:NDP-hexose 2,3-dehydratase family protein n=1 Tax=Pedobacter sp. ISL-64 TaxID=2819164 RepID=UPI001BEC7014|nr:NDP-hexose 2,3-dehydratase family protein [Pedobacter sp. ISL-64]MBT2562756.1 NDP-hexose 2,3-dehydratase family protein [Pedobacter sp. ISL-64]
MAIYNSDFKNQLLESILTKDGDLNSFELIISWFTNLKMYASLEIKECSINQTQNWSIDDLSVSHDSGKYFEVLGVKCKVGNREMSEWYQPIIRQREEGIIGFIVKKINGIYHLLIQAKLEAGNFDVLEMAPTVQCITGSYNNPEYNVVYLDYFLDKKGIVHYDTLQSEEGGRFYQEQNQNIVIEIGEDELNEIHPNYIWMTVKQAKAFIKFNNYFNIEARSLLACITPV